MDELETIFYRWENSLCKQISIGGQVARNPVANKWKATYRSRVLRECIFWRTFDLISQGHLLRTQGHVLGSRILLRSALETTAVLVYLNQKMVCVLQGKLDFTRFSLMTSQLLLGSKDQSTKHNSINILTVLGFCDKEYPGILDAYNTLCESAHPNYEGVCLGYSRVDHKNHETNFGNHWDEMWGGYHESLVKLIAYVFEHEYNDVWVKLNKKLEDWIESNDSVLQSSTTQDDNKI